MVQTSDPTLHAIVRGALEATGAAHGWLLANEEAGLRVVAVGGDDPAVAVGDVVPGTGGSYGYVATSGQPLALQPHAGRNDPWSEPHPLVGRVPASICAVPCEGLDNLVGVLEVVDKAAGPFSFDDVEVVTLLGGVAGAALDDGATTAHDLPDPATIAEELTSLRDADPTRYRRVTVLIEALLADV
jgi:hypothetical protein